MSVKKDYLSFQTSRRFAPLFATQFLGAFNDNVFKTALFVMISFYGLGQNDMLPPSQMLNLGALLFILPYFLFSALSGQLSNKFDKAVLARWIKVLEIAVMAAAAFGFYIQSAPLLLFCLFCMGTQSTLFGPLKYAVLPDYLNDKELMMGNSLIESGTFLAILFGQILGTAVAGIPPHIVGMIVLAVAAAGTLASLFMPSVPAKVSQIKIEANIAKGTAALMREAVAEKPVFTAIIGISWFWFVGSVYTTQLPTFTQIHLGGNDNVFNLMLALFSIGIAAGSVLCAKFSRERLVLGLVTFGTMGLTVCGLLLVWLTHGQRFHELNGIMWFLSQGNAYPVMLVMLLIGFFGGFFSVPLYTWLQTASSETFRAHAVAANNIVNGVFMVCAAVLSAVLLMLFDSITLLYLIVALGNVPLMWYLIKREPRFVRNILGR
ncbi:MFS transporter [Neisseria animalis]|uniref:MFS transporter n=1 Tax=Neisseria animalis TaxID=492 RepID=A0A5P3MP72_NEIAN|nr:MFS transporter [Neisseria animalis]QEY23337.1 MFS transporter [Neisseria animalis]ROW33185.1 MFS transporter [Neisseria animalis]VEE08710.1 major facilitator family transporter [Neisseria animalis]